MSFPIALSDLNDAGRVVYILDLNLGTEELEAGGGNVYRLATEPVTIDAGDGGEIAYLGGVMDLPDVVDEYGRSQINDEGPSIPIEVFIDGVDIAALWAKGKRFARARGELSAVTVGVDGQVQQTWPNRLKQALGRVELPRFGDPEADPGWLSFTLRSLPYNDVSVVNLPTAVVDEDTWAGAGSDVL
ncbi:MAG: hypothetical protein ACPHCN_18360, partial [Mycobacterium sp.]